MAKANPPLTDVLISGAGLNGLAAALLLAEAGARVIVIDPATRARLEHPDYDWRTTAIAQGAMRILDRIGAWDSEAWASGAITDIRIIDGNGPLFLHYDGGELGEGDLGCIVPNAALRRRMFDAVMAAPNIKLRFETGLEALSLSANAAIATLSNGDAVRARLAIGADGRNSPTRKLAGIGERSFDYGQISIVCTAAHAEPHRGVAHERFLPSGPFAILPLPDTNDGAASPHRSSIVWTERADLADRLLALEKAEFDCELAARFGDHYGAVETIGPIGSFPLKLVAATAMTSQRLALVGDAARSIHPIAGQGFNLGLRDSAELARRVADRLALGLDPGAPDVLSGYTAARLSDVASLVAATDSLNRLFSNHAPPLRLMRMLGLGAVQATPPLKRLFMRHAMGLAGPARHLAGDKPV
jgi:2-octaprenyl-6-methoxyphenol hydroxylase